MNSSPAMDGARRTSGAWTPLFAAQPVARDVLMALAEEVFDECVEYSDGTRFTVNLDAIVDRYAAQPPAVAAPVHDELGCEDIERLRLALSWEGYSTPESLESCAARWPSLVRDLISGVLDRKKRTQAAAQKGGAA